MKKKYSIGLDFGTLSARAVLVDLSNGKEVTSTVYGYQDSVINRFLPDTDINLPPNFDLQNPQDYLDATEALLKSIWEMANIEASQVISIGIAFTACTMLPVDKDMMPLCFDDRFRRNPHSWVKLWKHHGAQAECDKINTLAIQRDEPFIKRYGNVSSSEWLFAKVAEIYDHAPEVYENTYLFLEAGDWIVGQLTGNYLTSTCMAGFKAFWDKQEGYPSKAFFKAFDPGFENVTDKVIKDVRALGIRAGGLCENIAKKTGLQEGISVSVSIIDAHASFPAVGITAEDSLLMVMGTSLCHILVSGEQKLINGISGVAYDGVLPGYYGYEAGQAAVGDIYDWFVNQLAPYDYACEAEERNCTLFDIMGEKASALKAGESGLIALDWWNGNRSMLNNSNLSGMILGMTLRTTPEEIYRALIEATAFGTKKIIDEIEAAGVQIQHIYACGGLSRKSKLVMQVFSDVLGHKIMVSNIAQTTAYGAAMFGAVSAGREAGGFNSINEATCALIAPIKEVYVPNMENHAVYGRLYKKYCELHDFFGVQHKEMMADLHALRIEAQKRTDS